MHTALVPAAGLHGPGHQAPDCTVLSYPHKVPITGRQYRYSGTKASRSATTSISSDLVNAFWHFYKNPRVGRYYNMAGKAATGKLSMSRPLSCAKRSLATP